MNPGNLVKDIIEKIKLWFKNLFKRIKKKHITKSLNSELTKKTLYKSNIYAKNDKRGSSSIGTIYPKISSEKLNILNKKTQKLRKIIIDNNNQNIENELKKINEILGYINKNDILVNQFDSINELYDFSLQNITKKNSEETLYEIKNKLSIIIDKKLNDYENNIIDKAYKEYNQVNYITITTLIIDDIINEINELNEDFKKNKYSKIEYHKKIKIIKDKIKDIEKLHNKNEIIEEIDKLKKDFYTKKKDKYDLLYNSEIFVDLESKCDEILKKIEHNENATKIKKQIKKQEEQKKEKERKEQKKEKEKENESKKREEEIERENIVKRFFDIQIAHRILIMREKMRKKCTNYHEIIVETTKYYYDFLKGESMLFNFERNKTKVEVAKLYNDITSAICTIQKKEFIPLEHINIKLDNLVEKTLENQYLLNYMVEKKTKFKIAEEATSKSVTDKLTKILEIEKEKDRDKPKVLKKDYLPKKESKDEK